MRYWIFQGNPKLFKINDYISDREIIWWTARQKSVLEKINIGDRVYMWRSSGGIKGSGGLIALGTIVSKPVLISGEESKEYWKDEGWTMPEIRVQIAVDFKDMDNSNLRIDALKVHPILSNLTILKMPQNTNYEITQTQFEAIYELFEDGQSVPHFPKEFDSWTVYSEKVFLKTMDKSSFINNGSGIPKEMVSFWGAENLNNGQKKDISAEYDDKIFEMKITRENLESGRYRLFWLSDFEKVINMRFLDVYRRYRLNQVVDVPPKLRFEKVDEHYYKVSFIEESWMVKDIESEASEEDLLQHIEGAKKAYFGYKYERDPKCRKVAIEYHGTTCAACGFNFEKAYGPRGEGFIEIHHVKPLFVKGKESQVNPITDLIPLCSNCHRIVHREKENILTIDQLRTLIK